MYTPCTDRFLDALKITLNKSSKAIGYPANSYHYSKIQMKSYSTPYCCLYLSEFQFDAPDDPRN